MRGNFFCPFRHRNGEGMILHIVDTLTNHWIHLTGSTLWAIYPRAEIQFSGCFQIATLQKGLLFLVETAHQFRRLLTTDKRGNQHERSNHLRMSQREVKSDAAAK